MKKELVLAIIFISLSVLVSQQIPYIKILLLFGTIFIFFPLLIAVELKKKEIRLGERIFRAYYKILCYSLALFSVLHYPGQDWLAIFIVLFFFIYVFYVLFGKNKWKSLLVPYIYFQVSTLIYFIFI